MTEIVFITALVAEGIAILLLVRRTQQLTVNEKALRDGIEDLNILFNRMSENGTGTKTPEDRPRRRKNRRKKSSPADRQAADEAAV